MLRRALDSQFSRLDPAARRRLVHKPTVPLPRQGGAASLGPFAPTRSKESASSTGLCALLLRRQGTAATPGTATSALVDLVRKRFVLQPTLAQQRLRALLLPPADGA